MLGADPLSLDPVSPSYRETAAFASRSRGRAHYDRPFLLQFQFLTIRESTSTNPSVPSPICQSAILRRHSRQATVEEAAKQRL